MGAAFILVAEHIALNSLMITDGQMTSTNMFKVNYGTRRAR